MTQVPMAPQIEATATTAPTTPAETNHDRTASPTTRAAVTLQKTHTRITRTAHVDLVTSHACPRIKAKAFTPPMPSTRRTRPSSAPTTMGQVRETPIPMANPPTQARSTARWTSYSSTPCNSSAWTSEPSPNTASRASAPAPAFTVKAHRPRRPLRIPIWVDRLAGARRLPRRRITKFSGRRRTRAATRNARVGLSAALARTRVMC